MNIMLLSLWLQYIAMVLLPVSGWWGRRANAERA